MCELNQHFTQLFAGDAIIFPDKPEDYALLRTEARIHSSIFEQAYRPVSNITRFYIYPENMKFELNLIIDVALRRRYLHLSDKREDVAWLRTVGRF